MNLDLSKILEVFTSKGIFVQKIFVNSENQNVIFMMCKTSLSKKIFFIRVSEKFEIRGKFDTVENIKKVDTNNTQLNYIIESIDEIDTEQTFELVSYSELSIDVLHDKKFDSYIYASQFEKIEPKNEKIEVAQDKVDDLIKQALNLDSKINEAPPPPAVESPLVEQPTPVVETSAEQPTSVVEVPSDDSDDDAEVVESDEESPELDTIEPDDEELYEFRQLPEKTQEMNKYTSSFYVCIEISKFLKNKEKKFDEIDSEILSFTSNLNKKLSRMKEKRLKRVSNFFMNISKELEKKILEYKEQEIKLNTDISKLSPHLINAKTIINKNVNETVKREATALYQKISTEIDELNTKLQTIKDESSDLLSKFEIAIEKLKS